MSNFSHEYLGSVRVKSGKLVVVDPANIKAPECSGIEAEAAAAVRGEDRGAVICSGRALAIDVPFVDGEYGIFGTYDDEGNLLSVEIKLED